MTEGARSFQTTSGSLKLLTLQTYKICEVTICAQCRGSGKPDIYLCLFPETPERSLAAW